MARRAGVHRLAAVQRFLPSLLAAALLLPAAARAEDAPAAPPSPEIAFAALTDEILTEQFHFQPLQAVGLGLHQYDGKFVDFSRASIQDEIAKLHALEKRLAAIDPARLSAPSALDHKLLALGVANNLFQLEDSGAFDRNPMTYAGAFDANVYLKRDYAPLPDRLRAIVATERQVPALFVAAHANLAESLPSSEIELAIAIAKGGADFLQHDLVEAVKGVQDPALQAEFKTVNDRAAAELNAYADWLTKEKVPHADPKGYALGREKYGRMLYVNEALTQDPAQILEIGLAELRREQGEFAAAAKIIDPSKPAIEVFRGIQRNHPTSEGLLPDIRKHLEVIRGFMVRHGIVDIPSEVRANVDETPKYLRAGSFASSDNPGPFEVLGAQAYYYVTPTEPQWSQQERDEWLTAFNYYTADIVSVHEVYPGHYVQALRMNASPVSKVQRIFNSYAYVEGWAHYCEQTAVEEGFGRAEFPVEGEDPALQGARYHLAQSDEALLRICRLCVSIKLHTQGMSVEEATRFFMDNCYYEEKPARQEALRGTFDPGYLFYTVGKLELLKLRRDYRAQEGDKFSLKQFNDAITDHGAPPVRFLREILLKDASKAGETL